MKKLVAEIVLLCFISVVTVSAQYTPTQFFLGRGGAVTNGTGTPITLGDTSSSHSVTIIRGQNPLPIATGSGLDNAEMSAAASDLQTYLQMITGSTPTIVASTPTTPLPSALTGETRFILGDPLGTPVSTTSPIDMTWTASHDSNGFLIQSYQRSDGGVDIYIVARSGVGTHYGVFYFLNNYVGFRAVMGGPIGQVYTSRTAITVPNTIAVYNPGPDFLLRYWTGPGFGGFMSDGVTPTGFNIEEWLGDYSTEQRFQYSHNINTIYPPSVYGSTHPEYYAYVGDYPSGSYVVPTADSGWQITFSGASSSSHPNVADVADSYADATFTSEPQMLSISLTVNDGLGYSSLDFPGGDTSAFPDIYAAYVTDVANYVATNWPGRFVAFTPYNYSAVPPTDPLPDNVITFFLNEPKYYYDVAGWGTKSSHYATYLWLYGESYVFPNHSPHILQKYLQYVHNTLGGNGFKGEGYTVWGNDGPKMWVLANLLWNCDADVDALLTDYYTNAYGSAAAGDMATYFNAAEAVNNRRVFPVQSLPYPSDYQPDYYNIATWMPSDVQFHDVTQSDIDAMSSALTSAQSHVTSGSDNATRLDYTNRCFQIAKYYWRQYSDLQTVKNTSVASDANAATIVSSAADFYATRTTIQSYYTASIVPMDGYCLYADYTEPTAAPAAPDPYGFTWPGGQYSWLGGSTFNRPGLDDSMDTGFGAITQYKQNVAHLSASAIDSYWQGVEASYPALTPFAETQRLYVLHPGSVSATPTSIMNNLFTNGSFEMPDSTTPTNLAQDWVPYINNNINAVIGLDSTTVHDGTYSMSPVGVAEVAGMARPWNVAIKNHTRYRFSCWYKRKRYTNAGALEMYYGILVTGAPVTDMVLSIPATTSSDPHATDWTFFQQIITIDLPVSTTTFYPYTILYMTGSTQADDQMWFDNARFEELDPSGVLPNLEGNLLSNASFEDYKYDATYSHVEPEPDWGPYINRSPSSSVYIDNTTAHDGNACATFKGPTGTGSDDMAGLIRWVPLTAGHTYQLSFWYKTALTTDTLYWDIHFTTDVDGTLGGTTTWTYHSSSITVPSGATGGYLILTMLQSGNSTSQAWLDQVRLIQTSP